MKMVGTDNQHAPKAPEADDRSSATDNEHALEPSRLMK